MNISKVQSNSKKLCNSKITLTTDSISQNKLSTDDCKKISEIEWPNLKEVELSMNDKNRKLLHKCLRFIFSRKI